MSVIKVENLGKKYRIGANGAGSDGLRHAIHDLFTNPLRKTRNGHSNANQQSAISTPQSQEFWALKDVSFEVNQGEVVGIIGRNGAGKSTLLKILSRITEPTTGRLGIRGRVASLLEVGTGFHPELTGRENVFLNGAILGMTREEIKRKFDEIVAFAEIEKFIDTPVKRYSSGMYVRLAFAVAAHLEPEILIVDEVLAVGDAQFQKKCLGKMGEVARGGRTVLFVSHNMSAVKRLCTSAMLLADGRLLDQGDTATVISSYLEDGVGTDAIVELPEPLHMVKSALQISKVEILNSKRETSSLLLFGEQIHVKLSLKVQQSLPQVKVGIGVYADGVRIGTTHTAPIDIPASTNLHELTCSLPGTLLPGFYTLHVGAYAAETGRGLDWVPDAISFRIEPVATSGIMDPDERDWGLVVLNGNWDGSLLEQGKDHGQLEFSVH